MTTTEDVLKTYQAISLLAQVVRHNSTTFDANRKENVAEHSYSLTVLAAAIASDFNAKGEQLDIGLIAQFASVHDLVEAYMDEGDISVYASADMLRSKKDLEKQALKKLEVMVEHAWVIDTIKKYEAQDTVEARFVYALDKLVVHMNVILSNKHHARPSFSDYLRTETVARQKIANSYSGLLGYFDELCRMFRERPHFFKDGVDHRG